jgi:hypothetical protein
MTRSVSYWMFPILVVALSACRGQEVREVTTPVARGPAIVTGIPDALPTDHVTNLYGAPNPYVGGSSNPNPNPNLNLNPNPNLDAVQALSDLLSGEGGGSTSSGPGGVLTGDDGSGEEDHSINWDLIEFPGAQAAKDINNAIEAAMGSIGDILWANFAFPGDGEQAGEPDDATGDEPSASDVDPAIASTALLEPVVANQVTYSGNQARAKYTSTAGCDLSKNQVIIGATFRAGGQVDSVLNVWCGNIQDDGRIEVPSGGLKRSFNTPQGYVGGSGGNYDITVLCPTGYAMTGWKLRAALQESFDRVGRGTLFYCKPVRNLKIEGKRITLSYFHHSLTSAYDTPMENARECTTGSALVRMRAAAINQGQGSGRLAGLAGDCARVKLPQKDYGYDRAVVNTSIFFGQGVVMTATAPPKSTPPPPPGQLPATLFGDLPIDWAFREGPPSWTGTKAFEVTDEGIAPASPAVASFIGDQGEGVQRFFLCPDNALPVERAKPHPGERRWRCAPLRAVDVETQQATDAPVYVHGTRVLNNSEDFAAHADIYPFGGSWNPSADSIWDSFNLSGSWQSADDDCAAGAVTKIRLSQGAKEQPTIGSMTCRDGLTEATLPQVQGRPTGNGNYGLQSNYGPRDVKCLTGDLVGIGYFHTPPAVEPQDHEKRVTTHTVIALCRKHQLVYQ